MSFRNIKIFTLTVLLASSVCISTWAEDFANQIDSVKVKSAGDKSVVVDVYIKSDDPNIKPEMSTRKYKGDKYIIDLMKVTNKGSVAKDTSASSGLVNQKDVKVGNLPGGTARVLLNLNANDVNVKEVRYHIVKGQQATKVNPAPVLAKKQQSKPVISPVAQKKSEAKPIVVSPKKVLPVKVVATPQKQIKPVAKVVTKPEIKTVEAKPAVEVTQKTNLSSPQIVHKTNKPEKPLVNIQKAPVAKPLVVKHEKEIVQENENIIPANYIKPVSKPKIEPARQAKPKQNIVVKNVPVEKTILIKPKPQIEEEKQKIDKTLLVQAKPEPKAKPKKEVLEPGQIPLNLDTEDTGLREIKSNKGGLDVGKLFASIGLALLIIIPLIVLTVWLIKFFQKASTGPGGLMSFSGGSPDNFKILSSSTLGQGKSIHLVEIKGRQLVIGCTSSSINILTEFGDFDQFVEDREQEKLDPKVQAKKELQSKLMPPPPPQYKKSRPPLGSFADLYKDYQKKVDDKDLEDEY